jgi:hypothetical protein
MRKSQTEINGWISQQQERLGIASENSEAELPTVTVYRILCTMVHTSITSLKARHAGRERLSELGYCRQAEPELIGMLLLIAVDLLIRAGSELHNFSDLTEDEVKEAKRVWGALEAEEGG